MVSRLIFFTLLTLLLSMQAIAAPQLQLVLDKNNIQLGRSINAELYAIDLREKISTIDLSSLQKTFGVSIEETAESIDDARWPGSAVQMMQFKLYPRLTGQLTVPAVSLDGINSEPQTVNITQATHKTRTGAQPIEPTLTISASQPWERQQILLEVTLTIADTFVSLRTEELKLTGFEVYPLPAKTETTQHADGKRSTLTLRWALFPLVTGHYTLDLPAVRLRKSGRILGRFYFPRQHINVRPLPPYIPPTMPVGEITLHSSPPKKTFLYPDTLHFWDVSLRGNGVSPNWVPAVRRQIRSDSDKQFLSSQTQQELADNVNGLQSLTTHRIPFKATGNGWFQLPGLHLQYFDPHSGKIVDQQLRPQSIIAISGFWRLLITMLFLLLLAWSSKRMYQKSSALVTRNRLRKHAITQLRKATNPDEIHSALRALSSAEGWSQNLTLRDWAKQWQRHFRVNNEFMPLMDQLSQARYAQHLPFDISTLREKLLTQLSFR